MIVDASALGAVLTLEPGADSFSARMDESDAPFTLPIALFEAVATGTRESSLSVDTVSQRIHEFLSRADIQMRAVVPHVGDLAIDVFLPLRQGSGTLGPTQYGRLLRLRYEAARRAVPLQRRRFLSHRPRLATAA
jgi:uncharacterized protein with PIN domain